ncbi:Thioredoxin family protein [Histomonas meleagridis]|uniref:Thioredoxin family protein n=1 Tax=Histomonas meleagridis TaxID=135588 RepID=UPI00355998E5|nr:Thioredoxin family protein [Histomonas meleagridis]KAH0796369.1 Thioredoxin family protein [Histomonas meleagridis]
MLLPVLCLRISLPIGEFGNLSFLAGEELENFIQKEAISMIFVKNSEEQTFDNFNFVIKTFKNRISFAVTNSDEGKKYNQTNGILVFKKGEEQVETIPVDSAFSLYKLCNLILGNTKVFITHPEELRLLFEGQTSVLIGIDTTDEPKHMRKGDILYVVPSHLFSQFGLTVSRGHYVYRPQDRQLVKATGNYQLYYQTNVIDPALTDLDQKSFFAGFFIDTLSDTNSSLEMELLTKLSREFAQNFNIGPIVGSSERHFSEIGRFTHIRRPLFAVFRIGNNDRWAVNDINNVHNIDFLRSFLSRIENGTEPLTVFSSVTSISNELSFNNLQNAKNESKFTFVLYHDGNDYEMLNITISKALQLLNVKSAKFFTYDVSENELPFDIDVEEVMPILRFYDNVNQSVFVFEDFFKFENIVNWCAAQMEVNVPMFDVDKVKEEIEKEEKKLYEEL